MTQSNTFTSQRSEVYFESQRGWWQLKTPRIKRREECQGTKGVGFTIHQRRENTGSVDGGMGICE